VYEFRAKQGDSDDHRHVAQPHVNMKFAAGQHFAMLSQNIEHSMPVIANGKLLIVRQNAIQVHNNPMENIHSGDRRPGHENPSENHCDDL
jgi:hypothetical protein